MSVLIRGMGIPKTCGDCPCYEIEEGFCKVTYDDVSCLQISKQGNCPLVELPAEHGRLIDADALQQSIKESIDECHKWADEVEGWEMYARVSQSLGTFVECSLRIKAAPTIIEAEVEE